MLFLFALLSKTGPHAAGGPAAVRLVEARPDPGAGTLRGDPVSALSGGARAGHGVAIRIIGRSRPKSSGRTAFVARTAIAGRAAWFYLSKALLPAKSLLHLSALGGGSASLLSLPVGPLSALVALLWRNAVGWGAASLRAGFFLVTPGARAGFFNTIHAVLLRGGPLAVRGHDRLIVLAVAGVLDGAADARRRAGKVAVAAAAALVAVLAAATWNQSLTTEMPKPSGATRSGRIETAWMAWNNLAVCVAERAKAEQQPAQAAELFEEAIGYCDKAIALKPDYAEAYATRGDACRSLGRAIWRCATTTRRLHAGRIMPRPGACAAASSPTRTGSTRR